MTNPPQDTHVRLPGGDLSSGDRIIMDGMTQLRDDEGRPRIVRYEITINQSGLRSLVARANSNKTGKSVDGPIAVKIIF